MRGHGWHVFGMLVIVYIIMLVVNIVLGVIFVALPHVLGDGLSSVISGTIISPFLAVVVTLVYYRLSTGAPQPPGGDPWGGYQQSPQDPQNYGGYGQPPQPGGTTAATTSPRRTPRTTAATTSRPETVNARTSQAS